jgi:hypothetical protein
MPALSFGNVIDPWADHPAREKVRFYTPEHGFVTGLLPENFSFGFTNQYVTPLADIMNVLNTYVVLGQQLASKSGRAEYSAVLKELKRHTWAGGSPLNMSVRLLYVARGLARLDVVAPIKRLIQMSAGSVATRFKGSFKGRTASATVVKPPGVVQVEFGNVLRLKEVVITGVNWNYSSVVDPYGVPSAGGIDLTMHTDKVFISDDLDTSFVENEGSERVQSGTPGVST